MKNIHIPSTDQPSRLIKNINGQLKLTIQTLPKDVEIGCYPQQMYITSDEEIKKSDWCLDIKRNIIFQSKRKEIGTSKKIPIIICEYEGCYIEEDCKKIIITTDLTLIADGVQSIDDEFLEWFIKNPTCEFVEIKKQYITPLGDIVDTCYDNERLNYKTIIPQEEPKKIYDMPLAIHDTGKTCTTKQDSTEEWKELEDAKLCEPLKSWDEPKQSTLEEAALKWVFDTNGHKWSNNDDTAGDNYGSFIAGANYQAENMPIHILDVDNTKVSIQEGVVIVEKNDKTLISYSEEEVDLLVNELINKFTDWSGSYVYKDKLIEMYEQLKKK
jgi:hypothetical protein